VVKIKYHVTVEAVLVIFNTFRINIKLLNKFTFTGGVQLEGGALFFNPSFTVAFY